MARRSIVVVSKDVLNSFAFGLELKCVGGLLCALRSTKVRVTSATLITAPYSLDLNCDVPSPQLMLTENEVYNTCISSLRKPLRHSRVYLR